MLHLLPLILVLVCTIYGQSSSQFLVGDKDNRYIVLIISRLGFANRIRAMADWHQLAVLSRRTLLVSWEATRDCNTSFTNLFQSGPAGFNILPFVISAAPHGMEVVTSMAAESGLSSQVLLDGESGEPSMFSHENTSFVVAKSHLMSDTHVLVTDYVGVVILEDLKCQQYMSMRANFMRDLVPNDFAKSFIENFRSTYFRNRMMIGVHVRVHDPDQDWAVVPPLTSGGSEDRAVLFGEGATIEHFTTYMRQIDENFGGNARFFIASNEPSAKSRLLAAFPDAMVLGGDYSRESPEGIAFALIEWLILAESALILHTHGSSFAVEASHMHQRPLVSIHNGRVLHTNNHYLPKCGHLLYLRSYSKKKSQQMYVEQLGSSNINRSIASMSVMMVPCDHLREWGLPLAYCTVIGPDGEPVVPD